MILKFNYVNILFVLECYITCSEYNVQQLEYLIKQHHYVNEYVNEMLQLINL